MTTLAWSSIMAWLSVFGLVLQFFGSLLLFRYGLPSRVPTGGTTYLALNRVNAEEARLDDMYRRIGYVGIGLVAIGSLAQLIPAVAAALAPA